MITIINIHIGGGNINMKFYKLGKKSLIMSVILGSIVLTGCTTQANKEENLDNKNQIVVEHEL